MCLFCVYPLKNLQAKEKYSSTPADDTYISIYNDYLKTAERLILEGDYQKAYKYLEKVPINSPDEIAKQRQKLVMQILELEKQSIQKNISPKQINREIEHHELIKNTPENALLVGSLFIGFLWMLLCAAIGAWACLWNNSFILIFVISLFVSPFIGAIILLIMGRKKICKVCAERVKFKAIVCHFCGNNLFNVKQI